MSSERFDNGDTVDETFGTATLVTLALNSCRCCWAVAGEADEIVSVSDGVRLALNFGIVDKRGMVVRRGRSGCDSVGDVRLGWDSVVDCLSGRGSPNTAWSGWGSAEGGCSG